MDYLKDDNSGLRVAGAETLAKLSEQGNISIKSGVVLLKIIAVEFRQSIRESIPQIMDFLQDKAYDVRIAGAEAVAKLSEQGNKSIQSGVLSLKMMAAEFRESIEASIPQIVDLLEDSNKYVRRKGVATLAKLAEQGNGDVQPHVVLFNGIAAKFRESILVAIPQIVHVLKDNSSYISKPAVDALAKFSGQGNISTPLSLVPCCIAKTHPSRVPGVHSAVHPSDHRFPEGQQQQCSQGRCRNLSKNFGAR